jgi:DNA-binding response OmpR family regulator
MRFAALDDNASELELIQKSITSIGHECHTFNTGESLLRILRRESFDFLVLDWELPGVSGVDIVKWVRKYKQEQIPILLITNRRDERDIVYALSAGADDFMSKPVRVGELIARVQALLRRAHPTLAGHKYTWGNYTFMSMSASIQFNGQLLNLKPKEYELALFLFQNAGRLISRQHLQERIWGALVPEVNSRSLDTHISAIRNKLQLRPENGYHLISVYGFGYRLEDTAEENPDKQTVQTKLRRNESI